MTQIYIGILIGIICLLLLFGWAVCQAAGRASREERRREWRERREKLMREWGEGKENG